MKTEQEMIAIVIEEHLDTMTVQLSLLAKEINGITEDDIRNNNHPSTILGQFQNISTKVIDIAKGKEPYTTTQTEPEDEVDKWYKEKAADIERLKKDPIKGWLP